MAVIDEVWNYHIDDVQKDTSKEFECQVNSLRDEVLQMAGFKTHNYGSYLSPNVDEELTSLIEQNKDLRNKIDAKLEELAKQKTQYETYKQDQKLLSQEIKDTHEAYLMAKKCYKKYLKMYYTTETKNNEKHTIYIQFFTETKKESDNFCLRLLRDTKTDHYELLEVNPKLNIFEDLKKTLQDTSDLPGVLCSIRRNFLKLRKNKKS